MTVITPIHHLRVMFERFLCKGNIGRSSKLHNLNSNAPAENPRLLRNCLAPIKVSHLPRLLRNCPAPPKVNYNRTKKPVPDAIISAPSTDSWHVQGKPGPIILIIASSFKSRHEQGKPGPVIQITTPSSKVNNCNRIRAERPR